ncbi:olfactory receptor 1L4-like [Dendropsophus ebraccatus]|uniref:olfactory receptor 1L4-like n=1 Tax=Dendropsophus ebraccatus TaxID=150705 RepID=UPI0038315257
MEGKNETHHGFILMGFSDLPDLRLLLFSIFTGAYIICIVGNLSILILIISQPQLNTPMYFLMGNLAFVDICFTSITIPQALYGLITGDTYISFNGCMLQLFFYMIAGNMDSFLLAIMAFDRYSAVCHPLRYLTIMSPKTCISVVASSWFFLILHSIMFTVISASLAHCEWFIHHYFCDCPVVLSLSCSVPYYLQTIMLVETSIIILGPVFFILVSYILIIIAVLKLHSSKGNWQTFSTCSSHIIMVIIFYSTGIFMYCRPGYVYTPLYDRVPEEQAGDISCKESFSTNFKLRKNSGVVAIGTK